MTTTIPSLAIDSAPHVFRRGIMVSLKALIFIAVSRVIRGAVMPLTATLAYQFDVLQEFSEHLQKTHDERSGSEKHNESAQPPLSTRHLIRQLRRQREEDDRTYLVSPIGIVSGSGKVGESTNKVGRFTGDRIESADVVEIGKSMSREFPSLLISCCIKSRCDDHLPELHRWQIGHWWCQSLISFANDIEETINSPSSHATRSHTHLDPLGIPIMKELVVPSSIKDDLSRRKSGESSTQCSPGLLYISLDEWE